MKSFEKILKDGNEGYSFRDVIDNLTDEQIKESVEEYAEQFKNKKAMLSFAETLMLDLLSKRTDDDMSVIESLDLRKIKLVLEKWK